MKGQFCSNEPIVPYNVSGLPKRKREINYRLVYLMIQSIIYLIILGVLIATAIEQSNTLTILENMTRH